MFQRHRHQRTRSKSFAFFSYEDIISLHRTPTVAWNKVVATPVPRTDRSPSIKKESEPIVVTEPIVTTEKKRSKKQKKKSKEESTAIVSEPVTFSLEDSSAFPALGQEVSAVIDQKSESTKTNSSSFQFHFSLCNKISQFYSFNSRFNQ